jgi:hypothetical protein
MFRTRQTMGLGLRWLDPVLVAVNLALEQSRDKHMGGERCCCLIPSRSWSTHLSVCRA